MVATKPFSVRLSPEVERWIEQEARRTKRSKGSILDSLADEAIRMRRFPGIGFRGDGHERRAWILGTGWDVWEVIDFMGRMGRDEMLRTSVLTERQLDLAEDYYRIFPDEIDPHVAENRQPMEYWIAKYPSLRIEVHEL